MIGWLPSSGYCAVVRGNRIPPRQRSPCQVDFVGSAEDRRGLPLDRSFLNSCFLVRTWRNFLVEVQEERMLWNKDPVGVNCVYFVSVSRVSFPFCVGS